MQAVASRAWTVGGTWENGMRYTVVLMCVDRWRAQRTIHLHSSSETCDV